jgi:hypothetical protein
LAEFFGKPAYIPVDVRGIQGIVGNGYKIYEFVYGVSDLGFEIRGFLGEAQGTGTKYQGAYEFTHGFVGLEAKAKEFWPQFRP